MNINKDILNELLADPKKIENISLESLENLADEFPYFMGIQKLINTKKKQIEAKDEVYAFVTTNNNEHNIKHINNLFDKDDDDEFTELEIKEEELPFESFENEITAETLQTKDESIAIRLTDEEISTLKTLAGSPINHFNDDLSLLPHLTVFDIENLSHADITTYLQLVNIVDRNGSDVFAEAFKLSKINTKIISEQALDLFKNKYQKLLVEHLDFSNYKSKNDLKQIAGIGDLLEGKLNQIGVFTFHQLANLNEKYVDLLTVLIDYFNGRIERDNWKEQAEKLINTNNAPLLKEEIATETIENLAEKLAIHKNNKNGNTTFTSIVEEKEDLKSEETKTFFSWLNTFEIKKNSHKNEEEKGEQIMEYVEEQQPRLVKVNENNLNEIHTFLGNKVEDFQPSKPVFEFLPGFSVKEVAAKSLNEDQSIVSITLAKIYEKQQYFDKAINIYQKLILKYPEKSGFFANRIKNLEEKI